MDTPTQTFSETPTSTLTHSPTPTTVETAKETPQNISCDTDWAGEIVWSFERRGHLYDPTPTEESLLIGTTDGLLSLDPSASQVNWEQSAAGYRIRLLEELAVTSDGTQITAVNPGNGNIMWSFDPPGEYAQVTYSVASHDSTVFVAAAHIPTPSRNVDNPYGRLYGLDLRTGKSQFVQDLTRENEEWVNPTYLVAGPPGIFVALDGGNLLGVNHNGTIQWRRYSDTSYFRPALSENTVLQPTNGKLVALDASSGKVLWEDNSINTHVTVNNGVAYGSGGGGPDTNGKLIAIDLSTRQHKWRTELQGCGGQPIVRDHLLAIVVGCRDRSDRVALFDTDNGCWYGQYQIWDSSRGASIDASQLYVAMRQSGKSAVRAFQIP